MSLRFCVCRDISLCRCLEVPVPGFASRARACQGQAGRRRMKKRRYRAAWIGLKAHWTALERLRRAMPSSRLA
eukprot:5047274-Pyramimonas_sp.AAC.1